MIQCCLVHAQRVIRRYTTSRPRTDAGKAIYALALKLTRVTTLDQARGWTLRLHDFGQVFRTFFNEKTSVAKERRTLNNQWEWTHLRVRKGLQLTAALIAQQLAVYLPAAPTECA